MRSGTETRNGTESRNGTEVSYGTLNALLHWERATAAEAFTSYATIPGC